jgi:hypothetical protein
MATTEGGYNPIGYHVGTVWPHDNSIIAWGLRRYGFREEAARIAQAMLEAAQIFGNHLPEAFAGYAREETKYPVEYPTACMPQAWAAGTPLLLLRTMLGIESDGRQLLTDPAVPEAIGQITLLDIPGPVGPHGRIWARTASSVAASGVAASLQQGPRGRSIAATDLERQAHEIVLAGLDT